MFSTQGIRCMDCSVRGGCAFQKMEEEGLARLNKNKRTLTYGRGESIFHLGDSAQHFYCIRSGSVQLFRSSPYREQSFTIVGTGAWIGYRDAINGDEYRHSARALGEVTVCKFDSAALREVMYADSSFAAAVARDLAGGWVASENQSYNLGARKIMERLADFLLDLKQRSGDRAEIDFPLTREMVATLIGATTESVIRTLSDFKSRGWIDLKKGRIAFVNEDELVRLVTES